MRWNIVKQAWEMARKAFPAAKLYVDIPPRFSSKGKCAILDLEKDEPLGEIEYSIVGVGGKPTLALQLGGQTRKASLDRISIETQASLGTLKPLKLGSRDVLGKSIESAGEKAAALAIGHPSSPLRGSKEVGRAALRSWMSKEGFPEEAVPHAEAKLKELGVAVPFNSKEAKKHKEPLFRQQAIVRVVDPGMRDENKCGRVVQVSRKEPKKGKGAPPSYSGFAYLVLIDGASSPAWFAEWQLAPNLAGAVPSVPNMQVVEAGRGLAEKRALADRWEDDALRRMAAYYMGQRREEDDDD